MPLTANDKFLRCHFVVLSDMFITSCPDSKENMERAKVTE